MTPQGPVPPCEIPHPAIRPGRFRIALGWGRASGVALTTLVVVGCGGSPEPPVASSTTPPTKASETKAAQTETSRSESSPFGRESSRTSPHIADRAPSEPVTSATLGAPSPVSRPEAGVAGGPSQSVRPLGQAATAPFDVQTSSVSGPTGTAISKVQPSGRQPGLGLAIAAPVNASGEPVSGEVGSAAGAVSTSMPSVFAPLPVRSDRMTDAQPVSQSVTAATGGGHVLTDGAWTITLPSEPERDEMTLPDGTSQRTYHLDARGVAYLIQVLDFADPLDAVSAQTLRESFLESWAESMKATLDHRETVDQPTPGSIRYTATHQLGGRTVRTEGLATGQGTPMLHLTITGEAETLAADPARTALSSLRVADTETSERSPMIVSPQVERMVASSVVPSSDAPSGPTPGTAGATTSNSGEGRPLASVAERFTTPETIQTGKTRAAVWEATPIGSSIWAVRLPAGADGTSDGPGSERPSDAGAGATPSTPEVSGPDWMRWGESSGHAYTVSAVKLTETLPRGAAAVVAASLAEQIVEQVGGTVVTTAAVTDDVGVGQRTRYTMPAEGPRPLNAFDGPTDQPAAEAPADDRTRGLTVDHLTLMAGAWQVDVSITGPTTEYDEAFVEAILGSLTVRPSERVARGRLEDE